MTLRRAVLVWSVVVAFACTGRAEETPKRVLLLGQKRDHPEGRHEYVPGLRILEKCLKRTAGLEVRVAAADEPWPDGPRLLRESDAVLLYLGEGAKWLQATPERLAAIRDLARRRGGIVALHWSIGAREGRYVEQCLELLGGCHGGDDRRYAVLEGDVHVVDREHPITRGIDDFRIHDEFYFKLKFARQGKLQPILQVPIEGRPEAVAWAYERPGGGRSFGFGGMDEHRNWANAAYRRLAVQAVLWTLGMPVPERGVAVEISEEDLRLPAPQRKER